MPDFDLTAAAWRKDCKDAQSMIEALATRLEKALPGLVRVERSFSLFAKGRRVRKIVVQFADQHFFLQYDASMGVHTAVGQAANKVCLSHEDVPFQAWLTQLSSAISAHVERTMGDRKAIEDFLLN